MSLASILEERARRIASEGAGCLVEEAPPADDSGAPAEGCPSCGNLEPWGKMSWCPKCGFYPRLGISIGPALEVVESHPAPKTPLDVWRRLPGWARVLVTGILGIFVMSVAVRLSVPRANLFRNTWAALQLAIGLALFCTLHGLAMLRAISRLINFGVMDAVLHPIETWKPTFEELPGLAPRVWLAAWGLVAALCAWTIIGGINVARLVDDWGFRRRADSSVTEQARSSGLRRLVADTVLNKDFEESANERSEDEARKAEQAAQEGVDLELRSADCVVIGYRLNPRDGTVSELLLASVVDGKLQYVGAVSEGIPPEVRTELAERLKTLACKRPVVACSGAGTWVKPVVTCKTAFKSWTAGKMLDGASFKELLAEVDGVK